MILKALTLENFKGIREPVRIEFAPLTLLFGPNSSGKSTVLKALQFAAALLKSRGRDPFDVTAAEGMDLGTFRDTVNGHDVTSDIQMSFELSMPSIFPNYDPSGVFEMDDVWDALGPLAGITESIAGSFRDAAIHFRVRYSPEKQSAYLAQYRVDIDAIPFGTVTFDASAGRTEVSFLNYCHPVLIDIDPNYGSQNDSFKAWLDDWGGSEDEELSDAWGDGSNTAFEYYVAKHNRYPNQTRPFPIRIANQADALGDLYSPLDLELDGAEARLEKATPPHLAVCCIVSDGLLGPAWVLAYFLAHQAFLGPLRHIPSRDQVEFTSGLDQNQSTGEAAWRYIMHAEAEFISKLNTWLSDPDKLNTEYGVEVFRYREVPIAEPISDPSSSPEASNAVRAGLHQIPVRRRVVLRDMRQNVELTMRDVGIGLSQLLPILVESLRDHEFWVPGLHLVTVEQPELHLHPALQVRLADLFITASKTEHRQFLIETHSEHLMLRCLRRIRESSKGLLPADIPSVAPEDIAVHFIEATAEGPMVKRIEIDEEGDFINEWPGGFFEESFSEKFAGR